MSTSKNAKSESCELTFTKGQSEDCSPGDSTSDTSEKLPQKGGWVEGKVGIYEILVKEEYMQLSIFFQKVSTSLMKLC